MKLTRRTFVASTAATALIGLRPAGAADEKIVRFGMPQDFTKIYTFVTAEYSQGQRDYFSSGQRPRRHQRLQNRRRRQRSRQRFAARDRGLRAAQARRHGADRSAVDAGRARAGVARARGQDQSRHRVFGPQRRSRWLGVSLCDAAVAELLDAGRPDRRFLPPAGQGPQRQEDRAWSISTRRSAKSRFRFSRLCAEARLHVRDLSVYAAWQRSGRDLAAGATRQAGLGGVLGSRRRPDHRAQRSDPQRHSMDRMSSSVWISESDMDVVGKDAAKGVLKFEPCASGRSPKVIADILKEVAGKGQGAGPGGQDRNRLL